MRTFRQIIFLALLLTTTPARGEAETAEAAWAALREGGAYAMLRHALAPGTGDPPGFRIDDCSTQRNLDAAGRAQARAIGVAFRDRSIRIDGLYASQWCRCQETARRLDLGEVADLPALNSFYQRWERREPQRAALRSWLRERATPKGAVLLVTHQVNISALTGVYPTSGETVVFRVGSGGDVSVVGRIPPP